MDVRRYVGESLLRHLCRELKLGLHAEENVGVRMAGGGHTRSGS